MQALHGTPQGRDDCGDTRQAAGRGMSVAPGEREVQVVENGQRQRSQQRGPKGGPEQCWKKEPVRALLSRSILTHTD